MRFIKKLVILTGSRARGTLMLEKNGYGVWCKLSLFDLPQSDNYRFVVISGDDLFVMKLTPKANQAVNFELGEIGFDEIHAAVISDKVVMYGSNCATKLPSETIIKRVNQREQAAKEDSYIMFSGRDKKIDDYFKKIAPPIYNDFALAEKNYYPAYVTVLTDEAASSSEALIIESEVPKTEEATQKSANKPQVEKVAGSAPTQKVKKTVMEVNVDKKMMPYELERKYLSLIGAAFVNDAKTARNKVDEPEEIPEVNVTTVSAKEKKPSEDKAAATINLTVGEKPEVIAMARRVTLRDYRVEGAKKTVGRRATFFERSSAQLEKLMTTGERFTPVERLIPGSRFVKINYDQKRYYIVGVIGRDYICYGVPSVYSATPPEPLNGYARWLPFDADKPESEGFWMMYQDGVSGETLKS